MCERERERETDRQTDRQTDRDRGRETETVTETESEWGGRDRQTNREHTLSSFNILSDIVSFILRSPTLTIAIKPTEAIQLTTVVGLIS